MKQVIFTKKRIFQVILVVQVLKLQNKHYFKDYVKQKKRFYLKNIANMKEKFFLVQLTELIQDMYMLNLGKQKLFQVKMNAFLAKSMFLKHQLKFILQKQIIQVVEVSHTYQLQDHIQNSLEDCLRLKYQKFIMVQQKSRAFLEKQEIELKQLCTLKIKILIQQELVQVIKGDRVNRIVSELNGEKIAS